ncbi:MAG TPA: 50S ribosomal protein L4 [Phycisphaerae bacterium]|jgi:large subunit ribosomal protein L4|nr:50S ribosomal protein L4 [Phycisphaerae bacterium]HOB75744.1 50S ribosomal protein L4 [Phycisphaerae bacterium]HOJ55624.1 50S ribosomal protein L4 [Phycisphaerae bacterium]HOL27680.1 50S ribosomal protein L4 [Phycisphaerae bacterium]HPP21938.1 50S ribosomal protein L4 [Phycisphaerae bacterium]
MIEVPVYNMNGEQTGSMQVDEDLLGGVVRLDLLKQAVVMWRLNQRQGSARTKNRALVAGSTRKLFRQKGTGNARMGTVRQPIRRGGGRAHAKRERNYRVEMPQQMKRTARASALLAKLKAGQVAVVDPISFDAPKTKTFAAMLKAVGAERGCVFVTDGFNETVYKSGRNIPRTEIRQVHELNAYDLLLRRKVLFTRGALETVLAHPDTFRAPQAATA